MKVLEVPAMKDSKLQFHSSIRLPIEARWQRMLGVYSRNASHERLHPVPLRIAGNAAS
jgi:hypothetical protein